VIARPTANPAPRPMRTRVVSDTKRDWRLATGDYSLPRMPRPMFSVDGGTMFFERR
jgi:hypothetical protein